MAKSSWCTVTPSSGTGDGTVNVGASGHTGRLQRTTSLTFKATGADDKSVAIVQAGASEFITIKDANVSKSGGSVTITGATNSPKLTFALGTGSITLTLPSNYSANGVSTANGVAVAGDPGAAEQFNFSIQLAVPANTTIKTKSRVVTVTASGGGTANATISQEAGDPTLTVSPSTVSLEASGATKVVVVKSNTNWTVS